MPAMLWKGVIQWKPKCPQPEYSAHVDDAGVAVLFLFVSHVRAVPAQFAPDQRIGHGAHRLGIGRQIDARAVAAHVVVIDISFRLPFGEQDLRHVLRFHLLVMKASRLLSWPTYL